MHTVVVQEQITTIELMKEQSKKQKKTKNKRIKISCMKGLSIIVFMGTFHKSLDYNIYFMVIMDTKVNCLKKL